MKSYFIRYFLWGNLKTVHFLAFSIPNLELDFLIIFLKTKQKTDFTIILRKVYNIIFFIFIPRFYRDFRIRSGSGQIKFFIGILADMDAPFLPVWVVLIQLNWVLKLQYSFQKLWILKLQWTWNVLYTKDVSIVVFFYCCLLCQQTNSFNDPVYKSCLLFTMLQKLLIVYDVKTLQ